MGQNKKRWFYSSGSLAGMLTVATFSGFINFFYIDYLKINSMLIGSAMLLYGIYNAINDPLLGQLSDWYRGKNGTRIPFIRYGMIPFVIAFALLWLPKPGWFNGNEIALYIYFVLSILLFDGLYTLVFLNWTALYPELYRTDVERNQVSAIRQIFGIVGNIIGFAVPPFLASLIGWQLMGVLFAVISLVFIYISIKDIKEEPKTIKEGQSSLPFLKALKGTFANKPFVIYVLGSFFLQFTFVFMQAVMPFYVKYVLKVDGLGQSLVLGTVFISALFFVLGWSKVTNKLGAKRTMQICLTLFVVSLVPYWHAQDFTAGLIIAALNGLGLAGLMILIDVMLADVIDLDELRTGYRREGMYFGMNALIIRLGISLQGPILGYILATSGYVPEALTQTASAINGLKVAMVIVPIVSLFLSFIMFSFYPLNKQEVREIKEKLKSISF